MQQKKQFLSSTVVAKPALAAAKTMPNAVYPYAQLRNRREQKLKDEG